MMKVFLLFCWTITCSSFILQHIGQQQPFRWNYLHLAANDGGLSADPNLKEYMAGNQGKKWKGTRDVLPRRKQIPSPDYSPQDVCRIVLSALQNNDDPQLDHGAYYP